MRVPVNSGQPFRRDQAADLGFSRHGLTRAVSCGLLRRPLRSVYVDGSVPDTRDLRISCLMLVLPDHAVVWGRTAAWVWGVDSFGPDERDLLVPEYVVPHHRGRTRDPGVRPVEASIPAEDVDMVGGVRLTCPSRTAIDLARNLDRPWALAALDAFTHGGLVTLSQLEARLPALYHHPGVVQARELVGLAEPRTESWGESVLRLRVVDAGFPRPEPQIVIEDHAGRQVYRLDLGYREHRTGLEYDGEQYHGSRQQQAADLARRDDLYRRFGWQVYAFTRGDVLGRHPRVELAVGELLGVTPRLPRRW